VPSAYGIYTEVLLSDLTSKYTSLQYLTHVIRTKLESTFRKWLKWHTQNQAMSTVAQSSLNTIYAYETRYGIASHYL
jgi:hypothetical protein